MKTKTLTLALATLLSITAPLSHAGRPGGWFAPDDFDDDYPRYRDSETVRPRAPRSDYQANFSRAYRLGYEWGARDAACGFGRNYRRAYLASGCCWESYFMEGYAAGYEGQPCRH